MLSKSAIYSPLSDVPKRRLPHLWPTESDLARGLRRRRKPSGSHERFQRFYSLNLYYYQKNIYKKTNSFYRFKMPYRLYKIRIMDSKCEIH